MEFIEAVTTFREGFPSAIAGDRLVGLELEYPAVMKDSGVGVAQGVMDCLWEELSGRHEWESISDRVTRKAIGVRSTARRASRSSFDQNIVTVDTGRHTLEIALCPSKDIHEARAKLTSILEVVLDLLGQHGATLIGYGVQPVTGTDEHCLSPKSQYILYQKNIDEESLAGIYQSSLSYLALSAAAQTHVEVTDTECIDAVNMLNALSGLRIGLLGNSPIWGGHHRTSTADGSVIPGTTYDASRELFWHWSWPSRKSQVGIPPSFSNTNEYVKYLMDFRMFVLSRHGEMCRVSNHMPFREFFLGGESIPCEFADGRTDLINPSVDDVHTLATTAWFTSRLQSIHGTVEERASDQQPPDSHFAPAALTLGLVENLSDALRIAKSLSLDQWRDIRSIACHEGLKRGDFPGVIVQELMASMLEAAAVGLKSRGFGEEVYLQPLFERMQSPITLAEAARKGYEEFGIKYIVDRYDMNRLLQMG